MTEKDQPSSTTVKTGNVTASGGSNVNVAGRDIKQTVLHSDSSDVKALAQLFEALNTAIEKRPNTLPDDRKDLQAEAKELEEHTQKNEQPDESFIARRLRNIQRMAPDILDVIISTATSPVTGVITVIKKIAEKIKKDADAQAQTSPSK